MIRTVVPPSHQVPQIFTVAVYAVIWSKKLELGGLILPVRIELMSSPAHGYLI